MLGKSLHWKYDTYTNSKPLHTYYISCLSSCPVDDPTIFTVDNIWHRVGGQLNKLETHPVPVFKLPRGSDVFLHCSVRLCLKGEESGCDPVSSDD